MARRKKQSFARGEKYTGPKGIFDGDEVGGVLAHYALTEDGKELLIHRGEPVRLVQVDLAPGNPDDGSEEYRIAAPEDPVQQAGNVVELEPEPVRGKASAGA